MKKLAQLTLSLVNVERFQRLQVEQDSEKVQKELDQWKWRLNQQTKDWVEYREKVTKMTSKEMQNWLADESRILDSTTGNIQLDMDSKSFASQLLEKVHQDLMRGQIYKGDLGDEKNPEIKVPHDKLNILMQKSAGKIQHMTTKQVLKVLKKVMHSGSA